MLFSPIVLGNTKLDPDVLKQDRKSCLRIGPCGIGKKAVYLNSFFVDRRYYIAFQDIRRVFKRIAMSKNGFTGKGVFGTMPYLVVLMSDGTEKQCNFKFEYEVDNFISRFHKEHPLIPTVSAEAERRIREEREKEEARYIKNLSPEASASVAVLQAASQYLTADSASSDELSRAAKQKRVIDNINPSYKFVAFTILAFAVIACIYGVYLILQHKGYALYFVLFGFAFIFYVISMQVLPTAKNNRRFAQEEFDRAVSMSEQYIKNYPGESFPIPARYAHPAALARMIRVIREGRAQTTAEAWDIMKKDLKAINNTVTVSQTEYNEITAIKPMFLIFDYQD